MDREVLTLAQMTQRIWARHSEGRRHNLAGEGEYVEVIKRDVTEYEDGEAQLLE